MGFPKQAVGSFTNGFSDPKRFRDFRETGPWALIEPTTSVTPVGCSTHGATRTHWRAGSFIWVLNRQCVPPTAGSTGQVAKQLAFSLIIISHGRQYTFPSLMNLLSFTFTSPVISCISREMYSLLRMFCLPDTDIRLM